MSTLDLIRTLRRALSGVRDAHNDGALAEIARGLICELTVNLRELAVSPYAAGAVLADEAAQVEFDEIREGGMAVYA